MKTALIADTDWLRHEQVTLRRLAVGLVDQMVGVVRVTSEPAGDPATDAMAAEHIGYRRSKWRWLRDRQLRRLVGSLREREVDLIHALDGSLQRVAMQLAVALEVPMVCGLWSMGEVASLVEHTEEIGGAYLPVSKAMVEAVRRRVGHAPIVECCSVGVHATELQRLRGPLRGPDHPLCCIVVGDGRLDPHYLAMLEGMAMARREMGGAMYFFCAVQRQQRELWHAASRLGLLDQVSMVPGCEDTRSLLMQADVLIQPQPGGAVRTVVLEAMACGRPVIAAADPMADHLLDGTTARLMPEPSATLWAACLGELVRQPRLFIDLGESARRYAVEFHKASDYVARTAEVYRKLTAPPALPFTAA